METTLVQTIKLAIVSATGLSKDALHIYVGLIVFLVTARLRRTSASLLLPWFMVLGVALLGEALDMRDDLASLGHWRWDASLHDIINTLFWPSVLWAVLRFDYLGGRDRKPH
ncbi:hypothetical protein [Chitinimonas naiadis]